MAPESPVIVTGTFEEALRRDLSYYKEQLKLAQRIEISIDLVLAAKRQLGFLRSIDSLTSLHCSGPAVLQAIQRYQNCWMPLAARAQDFPSDSNLDATENVLLPPVDVHWRAYREFCKSNYGQVINCPLLPDSASEDAARDRCRKLWSGWFKDEPFDVALLNLSGSGAEGAKSAFPADTVPEPEIANIVEVISRQSSFYYQVSQAYMWEDTFLQTALERYKCFLHILNKSQGDIMCVPTYDIDLIWHAHQVCPVAYAKDTKALLGCVVDHDDSMERGPSTKLGDSFEDTTRLWESTFGHPYERAGSLYRGSKPVNLPAPPHDGTDGLRILEWEPVALSFEYRLPDINRKYSFLVPRRIVQVCILIKSATNVQVADLAKEKVDLFVRLRALQAHKLLKLDTPVVRFTSDPQWQKLWLLHCEVATMGVALELRCRVDGCLSTLNQSRLIGSTELTWKDLQSSPMLSTDTLFSLKESKRIWAVDKNLRKDPLQLRLAASITPPLQGPYLLKSVPDRVTDDAGAMLSTLILRMNKYQPQRGRWISRTVLNHMGKECFVIRIRVAKGIWRKSGDRPVGVEWNERVIIVCEGGWNYVAGPTGYAPSKMVGSATPYADDLEHYRLSWHLSTGATLTISRPMEDGDDWEHNLDFSLTTSFTNFVRLMNGRKLQYEVLNASPVEEEGFVTLIRYNAQAPQGKATALFNWKVSAMEVHPDEDAVLVLLLCTATMRSVADFGGKHPGDLYAHRRHKEAKPGLKDWGSVVVEHATAQSNLAAWFLNAPRLMEAEDGTERMILTHAGPMGGACASSCEGAAYWKDSAAWRGAPHLELQRQGWREVTAETSTVGTNIGTWGRRTGSGIQLDASRLPIKSSKLE